MGIGKANEGDMYQMTVTALRHSVAGDDGGTGNGGTDECDAADCFCVPRYVFVHEIGSMVEGWYA